MRNGQHQVHQPLAVRDDNVEATKTPNVAHEGLKAKRSRWNEAHQIGLVNYMCMDECCTIGKGFHGAINGALLNLHDGLRRHLDGLFGEHNMCQRTV